MFRLRQAAAHKILNLFLQFGQGGDVIRRQEVQRLCRFFEVADLRVSGLAFAAAQNVGNNERKCRRGWVLGFLFQPVFQVVCPRSELTNLLIRKPNFAVEAAALCAYAALLRKPFFYGSPCPTGHNRPVCPKRSCAVPP